MRDRSMTGESPAKQPSGPGRMGRTSRGARFIRLLKSLAIVFAAVATFNLFVQVFAHATGGEPPIGLMEVLASQLVPLISSLFFLAFVQFVQLITGDGDEEV